MQTLHFKIRWLVLIFPKKRGNSRMSEKTPEQLKKEMYYDPCPEEDEEYEECETCDYTGEDCFGDKRFCEECPILTDDWGEESA